MHVVITISLAMPMDIVQLPLSMNPVDVTLGTQETLVIRRAVTLPVCMGIVTHKGPLAAVSLFGVVRPVIHACVVTMAAARVAIPMSVLVIPITKEQIVTNWSVLVTTVVPMESVRCSKVTVAQNVCASPILVTIAMC